MNVTYCKSWFRALKEPTELWSLEKAEQAHGNRQPYGVLIGDPKAPTRFLEINNDFVGVGFLDDRLRESLTYQFQEIEPGKLFLSMVTYREFEGDSDAVTSGTTYYFSTDGSIKIERESFDSHKLEMSESKEDVSGNYEDYPDFGQYDSLVRAER